MVVDLGQGEVAHRRGGDAGVEHPLVVERRHVGEPDPFRELGETDRVTGRVAHPHLHAESGPERGAGLDRRDASRGELDDRGGRVLDLDDPAMDERVTAAGHAAGPPHEPLEKVDVVDDLGHEDAATFRGLTSAPGFGVVLRVAIEPGHHSAGDRLAEPPVVDRRPNALGRGPEPALKQHAEPHSDGRGGGNHAVGLFDAQRDRFLAQHMGAVPGRRQHAGFVRAVRSADGDGVQSHGQHLVDIAVRVRDAVGRGEDTGAPRVDISDCDDLDVGDASQRGDMIAGNLAAAHDSYPHRELPSATVQARSAKDSRSPRMAIS
jgi:hypothetical protein